MQNGDTDERFLQRVQRRAFRSLGREVAKGKRCEWPGLNG